MSKQVWTLEKDELLIELVKSKRGLYDLQSPHYSDNIYKKKNWDEIQIVVEVNGAKIRWESLRAQYRKYLAKLRTKSGQAATKICKWRYCDQMQFLNDYLTVDRPRISSIMDEEIEQQNIGSENSEEVVVQATSLTQSNNNEEVVSAASNYSVHQSASATANKSLITQTQKIKRTNVNSESASSTLMKYILENKKSERPVDAVDQFFSLMATTVKKFSPFDQHQAKTEVFLLISKIEEKYLAISPIFSSPTPSAQSSSSSHYLDMSQSRSHGSSRDCSSSVSQHTYIQQQPVNSECYADTTLISNIPTTSYNDSSSGLQRSTASNVPVSTVVTENNLQAQYLPTLRQHQGVEEQHNN